MRFVNNILEIRKVVVAARHDYKTIGLVPTMGFLHAGHASLIKKAKETADIVIVSIFVNPLQFNVQHDLDNYPRNLEGDAKLCNDLDVDVLFSPGVSEMYPNGISNTLVNVNILDRNLCGRTRPGHFLGVCTVVSKLFNIVDPDIAFFGKKDIQQLRIIETMVRELNFNISIIGCDIIRGEGGLALSSRNAKLSNDERHRSLIVPQLLHYVLNLIQNGMRDVKSVLKHAEMFFENTEHELDKITNVNIKLDYLEIVDYQNLQLLDIIQGRFVIATAVFIGNTRLIDNLEYEV